LKGRIRLQEPVRPSELSGGVPIIVAAFSDAGSFLAALTASAGPAGELAVETRYSPHTGTLAVLEVTWHGLPNRVLMRAFSWRRTAQGLLFRLHPQEVEKREYLRRVAAGTMHAVHRRKHRRFCVRLPLQWRRFGEPSLCPGVAVDLSSGGVLVAATTTKIEVGERVAVRLRAETAESMMLDLVVTGIVQHVRQLDGEVAFGVKFEYRSSGEQRNLRALLRVFAAKGVVLVNLP
jgi:hypothetical protein